MKKKDKKGLSNSTIIIIVLVLFVLYNSQKSLINVGKSLNNDSEKHGVTLLPTLYNPTTVTTSVSGAGFLTLETDYSFKATDENKRFVVVNPITLSFPVDGKFNFVVRAFPVVVNDGLNTLLPVATLESGEYFVTVLNNNVSIV